MTAIRWARAAWVAVIVLIVAAGALAVPAAQRIPAVEIAVYLASGVLALSYASVGVAVIRARPGHSIGWILLAFAAVFAVKVAASGYAIAGLDARHWPLAGAAAWLQSWVELLVFPTGIAATLLLFPTGRLHGRAARLVLGAALAGGVLVLAERITEPGPLIAGLRQSLPMTNPSAAQLPVLAIGWPIALLATIAATVELLLRGLRRTAAADDPAERRAMRLLGAMALLLSATIVMIWPAGMLDGTLRTGVSVTIALLFVAEIGVVFPLVLAVAVRGNRLYGLDRLLDRALTYAGLTAIVVIGYVVVIGYLGELLGHRAGDLGRLVATAVVAVAFTPLRERLQRLAARVVYGPDGDPRAVVARIDARLQASTAPVGFAEIAAAMHRAVGLDHVELVVGGAVHAGGPTPAPGASVQVTALIWQGERVGDLRYAAGPLPAERRRLLDELTGLAARVAADVRRGDALAASHRELAAAHRRLLDARDHERRRLRQDLHDGVQPGVAGLRLTLHAVRRLVGRDDDAAVAALSRADDAAGHVSDELRSVVERLRPTRLDELGLVGAVGDAARRLGLTATVDSVPLGVLPADVEVAALRIMEEALHNVAAHAGTTTCAVTVAVEPGWLRVTVVDDGVGAPDGRADPTPGDGIGLASMRQRAADLGGECRIEPGPIAGTAVSLRLPLSDGAAGPYGGVHAG